MNTLKNIVLTAILLMLCHPFVLIGETFTSVESRDSLVMVIARSFVGRSAGIGFVIGDGTLVVTAHHLVFGHSKKGRHMETGQVSVVSPYIGDGCEARIIAADEKLDLAVLKIPWKGHPALKLADEQELLSAEQLVVIGIPDIVRNIGPGANKQLQEDLYSKTENLAIDYVAVHRKIPRFISLGESGQLGPGWSGSPMLLPDSATAAGCFTALLTKDDKRVGAKGPTVIQIRHLLRQSGAEQSLEPGDSTLPRCGDGIDAFLSFARAYHDYLQKQYDSASDRIAEFISLRPESSFAYILSASNADKQKDFDLADQHYRKAIALNPEAVDLQLYYAQFLSSRNPDKALEILQDIWHVDESKPTVAALVFNILIDRDQFDRAGEFLNEALKLNPRNAYLWIGLSGYQHKLDQLDEAIESNIKAVDLLPERGPFRGRLAHIMEKAGRLDEAEKHFRELLKIEPNNPVVYVWLAQFLGKHRPEAVDEAVKVAQTALELPPKRGLPKQKIEQIIQNLQSQTEPAS